MNIIVNDTYQALSNIVQINSRLIQFILLNFYKALTSVRQEHSLERLYRHHKA